MNRAVATTGTGTGDTRRSGEALVSDFEVITERVHQYLTSNLDDVTRPAKHSWWVTLDSVVVNIEQTLKPSPRPMDEEEIARAEAGDYIGWVNVHVDVVRGMHRSPKLLEYTAKVAATVHGYYCVLDDREGESPFLKGRIPDDIPLRLVHGTNIDGDRVTAKELTRDVEFLAVLTSQTAVLLAGRFGGTTPWEC